MPSNPLTPEAVVAMHLYSDRYASQDQSAMDFWFSLPQNEKARCNTIIRQVIDALYEQNGGAPPKRKSYGAKT